MHVTAGASNRQKWEFWSWRYRGSLMWVLQTKPGSCAKAVGTTRPSFYPHISDFGKIPDHNKHRRNTNKTQESLCYGNSTQSPSWISKYSGQCMHIKKLKRLGKEPPEIFSSGDGTWNSHQVKWALTTTGKCYTFQWIRKNPQQRLASAVWMCEIVNTRSNNILLLCKTF